MSNEWITDTGGAILVGKPKPLKPNNPSAHEIGNPIPICREELEELLSEVYVGTREYKFQSVWTWQTVDPNYPSLYWDPWRGFHFGTTHFKWELELKTNSDWEFMSKLFRRRLDQIKTLRRTLSDRTWGESEADSGWNENTSLNFMIDRIIPHFKKTYCYPFSCPPETDVLGLLRALKEGTENSYRRDRFTHHKFESLQEHFKFYWGPSMYWKEIPWEDLTYDSLQKKNPFEGLYDF